jgi:beta-galactosidase
MRTRKAFILLIFIILSYGVSGIAQETTVREKLAFNSSWKFTLGDNPEFRNKDYDDASWRMLTLPHDWSIEGDCKEIRGGAGGFFPIGVGWYRKSFVVPESMKQKQVTIQFDGVYMNSEVWINDHFLGCYPYGYTTFQYDITEFLKQGVGEKNTIAVRVDNSLKESTRWYTGSGIYRNVWLLATNFVHFDNYKGVYVTTPEVSTEKATVNVNYEFAANFLSHEEYKQWKNDQWNYSPKTITKTLLFRSTITDKNGTEIARTETEQQCTSFLPVNKLSQQIQVDRPKLWSNQTPELYYLKSEILCDGQIIDDQLTSFGIRKLEYIPHKGMFVNGKPEKLKGVCLHQDAGSFGVAVPIQIWQYRLLKLKETGCNAVRTSHHPFAPEFYDLCDSLGFYVMNEAFDEWTEGWYYNYTENTQGKAENGYHLYFNQWAETDLKAMLWRDRNHPSVVMYSIGNEIPNEKSPSGSVLANKLVNICHAEDSTRPVTAGVDEYIYGTKNGFIDAMDISGYNYIDRDYKDTMYKLEYKNRPEKLCVGTETNKKIQNYIAYRDNDYVVGAFIWVGIDYWGESETYPLRGFPRGLLDVAGFEKPEYYLYKSYWSDIPTVHIAAGTNDSVQSKWNWKARDTLSVYVYSNCDEVELFLNNRSLGKKVVDKNVNYYALWQVKYKAGTLKAVGYNAKKKVSEDILRTSSEVYQILAKYDKTTLIADGKDISFIEISMVDNNGVLVADADEMVTVNVSGEATLVGLDSGDIYYTGLFKTNKRKVFNGKLLVAVQSTYKAGTSTIELTSAKTGAVKLILNSVK